MAYVIEASKTSNLPCYLPYNVTLADDVTLELDALHDSDKVELFEIFSKIVQDGQTYPQEKVNSMKDFEAYYCSHDVFVVRGKPTNSGKRIYGGFYIKPNFPGRCSHICNAGFIVREECRGKGIGKFLMRAYLNLARDLNYKSSFFNLVFESNTASVRLCDTFGFKLIGIIPKAGNLKDIGFVNARQYYFDLVDWDIPTLGSL